MAAVITLAVAKEHLKVTDTDHDPDITRKIAEAEAIVYGYLKLPTSPFAPAEPWTEATLPPEVRAAILHVLAYLFVPGRGDAPLASGDFPEGWLAAVVGPILVRWRDPALA